AGMSDGTTQFTRSYNEKSIVTLTAPATAPNGNIFDRWLLDGNIFTSGLDMTIGMAANHTATAVYRTPGTFTVTVYSFAPNDGVGITVTPNDTGGLSNGTTTFARNYPANTSVNFTAPATAGGNIFQKWMRNGVDISTSQATSVLIDANFTLWAVYVPPPTFSMTVASSNPNSGVNITVSPNDVGGLGNGTTQFGRTYYQNTSVSLTAPTAAGNGNVFDRWLVNGNTST